MTDTGIELLDLYLLSYAGIKVIFQVCKTTRNTVFLVELATKKYRDGYSLTKTFKPSKKPLIIKNKNIFTKSTYEVCAIRPDKKLPIKIDLSTKIFWEAQKYVDYPLIGTFLAVPFVDYLNKYWKKPKKKEKEKNIWA